MKISATHCSSYELDEVRGAFLRACRYLGYPAENPLGGIVRPGDTVFIKPNWVAHAYRESAPVKDDVFSVITHPSVIQVVAEFTDKALAGSGRIIIGDNPSIDCNFEELMKLQGLSSRLERITTPLEILDLRPLWCDDLRNYGVKDKMKPLPGDPRGIRRVDLADSSAFAGVNSRLFRGVFTDRTETLAGHRGGRQLYDFSGSIASADVYISIPKLKTHHKTGTTINLKGLVGTQANKNLLVHWRSGFPLVGGDEYPDFLKWLKGSFAKVKKRGAWDGNDTIWRMVADLYAAFFAIVGKRTLSVVDGIVGGEGNGPFTPRAKKSEAIIVGEDLLAVDVVASRLMGFDVSGIPYLRNVMAKVGMKERDIEYIIDFIPDGSLFDAAQKHLNFAPPAGWSRLASDPARGAGNP